MHVERVEIVLYIVQAGVAYCELIVVVKFADAPHETGRFVINVNIAINPEQCCRAELHRVSYLADL